MEIVGDEQPAESREINLESWFSPGRFALFFGFLIAGAFTAVLFGSRTFVFHDFGLFGYPLAFHHRQAFWQGNLPFWDPLNNCGVPFLAQWNTLTLYPLSLIYLLLPLAWSLAFFNLFHLYFAGIGMYFLGTRFSGNRFAGALAGLAFAFNGLSLNCLMWPNNIAALGWMPWVVLLVWNAAKGGKHDVLKAALVSAMQILTGAPEFIGFTWMVAWTFCLVECWRHRSIRPILMVLCVGILAKGVAAVQLIPFADLLLHSQRDRAFGSSSWSLPGWGLANFFVPLFYTYPLEQNVHFQYTQFWTSSYYLPIGIFLLALNSIRFLREKEILALWLLGLLALLLAWGDAGYLYPLMRKIVPASGFLRYPVKFVTILMLIGPLLAAYALARLVASQALLFRSLCILGGVASGVICILLVFAKWYPQYPPPYSNWPGTLSSGIGRIFFLGLFLACLFPIIKQHPQRWVPTCASVLLLLVWVDVLTHTPNQNPTVRREVYAPDLDYLKPKPQFGAGRAMMSPQALYALWANSSSDTFTNYLCNRLGLNCNVNLLDDIAKIDGFFSLNIKEAEQIRALLYGKNYRELPALRDFLGVTHVTAPGKNFDWVLRTNAMPLVTGGQEIVFAEDLPAVQSMIHSNFNPRAQVFLPPEAKASLQQTNRASLQISNVQAAAQRITFTADASTATVAVVAQNFYHRWSAYVDGSRVPLLRANYAFQAIPISSGKHEIKLVYEDKGFLAGLGISLVTLAAIALLWRTRRADPLPPSA